MRIQIERNSQQTWLNLPCTEQEMQDVEQKIGIHDSTDTKVLLAGIDCGISELEVLVGKTHDLDHLNLLARYIDGMCENECTQYRAALFITKATELKDIINLTQHTQNYSLITPTDTLENAGRNHYLDLHGCYTVGEEEKLNFSGLAAELIASGKGISTPYGLAFENGLDCPEFFNGENITCYYDRQFVFGYSVCNGYNEEYIFLPCHEDEITKALHRLGVQDLSQCRVYNLCITLQNVFSHDLAGILGSHMAATNDIGGFAYTVLTTLMGLPNLLNLFFMIALGYCVVKIFFANIKRSGILLIQIAVGSLYMFSIPKGYTDGFVSWCKQIIALCLTAFLQMTLLFLGLLTWQESILLAIGVMLSANEVPRIAQHFGLDTSMHVNMMSAVHTTTSVVNLTKAIARK